MGLRNLRRVWTSLTFFIPAFCSLGLPISGLLISPLFATPGAAAALFEGKQIRYIVCSPAGGGYDLYGRLFAQHLGDYLPGRPSVVVENMPGAAGLVAVNYFVNQAPRDGTVIGNCPGTIATAPLFKVPGARFDARSLTWIGSMTSDTAVTVAWASSPVKAAKDLFSHELVVGGVGATDATVVYPNVLNAIIGTKFKVISGYHGTSELALALERGEIQGIGSYNYASLLANKGDWITEKRINIVMQIGLKPSSDLPTVPSVMDLASNDSQRDLLRLIFAPLRIGRPIIGPPNMRADATEAYRNAFDRMFADPAFQADAKLKNINLVDPMAGSQVQAFIESLYKSDPALVTRASQLLGQP